LALKKLKSQSLLMKTICFYKKINLRVVRYFTKISTLPIAIIFFTIYSNNARAQSRLYLASDDHTDYMWTAAEATYDSAFIKMIDSWIASNNATSTNPADYQTKFNCDGTYWAWVYEKNKTPAEFQNFINQVKSEKMVVPINPLVITYGCVPAEATIRGMYYAGELKRKYNVSFDLALSMENQVMPIGLASLWKGCGAKYSWRGICNCVTQVPGLNNNREHEIYWYKGLDDQEILMKWYNFTSDHILGNYLEARNPSSAITDLEAKLNTPGYNYNIAAAFGVGGDDLETTTDHLVAAAEANTNASTQIIVSNELDFFRDFETTYGSSLPSLTKTYGNEWEDACASLSEVSAVVKRSLEKLRSAEAMATIVTRTNPTFANTLDSLRREAWMSLGLYWEHDFGGNGPSVTNDERAAWERRQQQNFSNYVDQLYTLAKANLANQIKLSSSNQRFFVFNPLSWTRTDYSDYPYSGTLPVHVVDVSTDSEVKSQIVNSNGVQYLRILAPDVPSVGYKIFEIRSGTGTSTFPDAGSINTGTQTIDNDFFTIVFTNNGVITSIIDKTNGNKQLVNTGSSSDYINNISLNDTYSGNTNSNGTFRIDNIGPVSVTVKFTSGSVINHETLITVFKDIPRIEIQNQINQNFGNDFLYTTFSFNNSSINSPTIWHEENGAVIHAKKVSNGGHYADQQARYDWLTLNHFASISNNGNYGVTLSNEDCYFMQTGNSTITSLDENTAKIKVLVGGRVDGLGMTNQGNDAVFTQRFAITAYNTYSAVNSMKSALEHQDGFISAQITNTSGILPEDNFSFMNISDPNTLLWALKPAEEGMDVNGAIVRVWNLANTPATPAFNFNDNITDAKNITHIETDISAASFSDKALNASIGKNQIKSYRVKLIPSSGPLPVSISEFTGIKQNSANLLSWKEDSGSAISYFTIERSEDGNSYATIDSVKENGNISYTYSDNNINELKPYYYRLKIITKTGNILYSDVILIKVANGAGNILLYPNPAQDQLKFQLIADKQSRYNVWITDISGKTVIKVSPPLFEQGNNYFTIDTENLPTGSYTLIVANDQNKYVRQFVKH
jgi:alpha-mannosidase